MALRMCAVSVDIDETHHYFDIHGLPRAASGAHAAYDTALPRIADYATSRAIPITFFAVGADLARVENARVLSRLAEQGHAVENHSYSHRYDLTRLEPEAMRREIDEGTVAITRAVGRRPSGFRAPGYTVNDRLFDVLEELGIRFDSSVFPCPPYYLAKAAIMGRMRLQGRVSRSVLDTPRVMLAPREPYRPSRRWFAKAKGTGARGLWELPVQVTKRARLPFIGTTLGLVGPSFAAHLARSCVGDRFLNLELHAMDFLDVGDGLGALRAHQPELRRPLAERLDALSSALDVLARAGYAFVRLDEVIERLGG